LYRSFEDGALSPYLDDTPDFELNFLGRAFVGGRCGIGDDLWEKESASGEVVETVRHDTGLKASRKSSFFRALDCCTTSG